MASRRIYTRAYPDPNPPEIVDNPESILRKTPKSKTSTVVRPIHRANYVPKNLLSLQDTQVDLRNPIRTRSLNDIDQIEFEPSHSPQHSEGKTVSRETTPLDLHFIHNFGFSHPRSAQQSLAGPSNSIIHTPTVQTTPFHPPPPLINPPLVTSTFGGNSKTLVPTLLS